MVWFLIGFIATFTPTLHDQVSQLFPNQIMSKNGYTTLGSLVLLMRDSFFPDLYLDTKENIYQNG